MNQYNQKPSPVRVIPDYDSAFFYYGIYLLSAIEVLLHSPSCNSTGNLTLEKDIHNQYRHNTDK